MTNEIEDIISCLKIRLVLNDTRLSDSAKNLMMYLISTPKMDIDEITQSTKVHNENAVRDVYEELKNFGYINV